MGQAATAVRWAGECRPVECAMKRTWERGALSIVSVRMLNTVTNLTGTGVNTLSNQF